MRGSIRRVETRIRAVVCQWGCRLWAWQWGKLLPVWRRPGRRQSLTRGWAWSVTGLMTPCQTRQDRAVLHRHSTNTPTFTTTSTGSHGNPATADKPTRWQIHRLNITDCRLQRMCQCQNRDGRTDYCAVWIFDNTTYQPSRSSTLKNL